MKLAYELLADVTDAFIAGDSAYDAAALRTHLESNRCTVVIPSNPTRATQHELDGDLYKERLARNFLAFVHLACALVWLA